MCLRPMEWVWRGETFSATASEYYSLKNQLQVPNTGATIPRFSTKTCVVWTSAHLCSIDKGPTAIQDAQQ